MLCSNHPILTVFPMQYHEIRTLYNHDADFAFLLVKYFKLHNDLTKISPASSLMEKKTQTTLLTMQTEIEQAVNRHRELTSRDIDNLKEEA